MPSVPQINLAPSPSYGQPPLRPGDYVTPNATSSRDLFQMLMAMLMQPAPDPRVDEAAYLARGVAFAKRIAGTRFKFDEAAHRALLRAELVRTQGPGGMMRQMAAIAATGSLRPVLSRIAVPTLVVHGTDDALIPPGCGRDTADHIEGAEFLLVEGMGHDVPADLFDNLAQSIATNAQIGRAHV